MDIEDIEIFIGIDVGKTEHWATALSRDGWKVFDRALPNDEARLRSLYDKLADHGNLLVVVGPARHHRGPGGGSGSGDGHHRRLPARTVDATHRRPDTRQRQNRRPRRGRHRRRCQDDASHPARHQHLR